MSLFKFFFCCSSSRNTALESSSVAEMSPSADSASELSNPESPTEHDAFILNMPDLVMREILKNLDILSIQKLRKVCHALREFIDYSKPDNNFFCIAIEMEADESRTNEITGRAFSRILHNSESEVYYKSNEIFFKYAEHNDGCEVTDKNWPWKKNIIEKNFIDAHTDDFLIPMLKNQKSLLDSLYLLPTIPKKSSLKNVEKFLDSVVQVLESRDRLLKVKFLAVCVVGQDQLMELLRCVDLKSLKVLQVFNAVDTENYEDLYLNFDILEGCETLFDLHVHKSTISSKLSSLAHILNLIVHMDNVHYEELLDFKERFIHSKNAHNAEIHYKEFPDKSRFLASLGFSDDSGHRWFFEMPDRLITIENKISSCFSFKSEKKIIS
ncbi:hypothetical protein GCK72_021433 [Caenorhabditis remanei]|uniref:F-box domain-containing protein n=1 Tax=Caenorhabditis remanei TaxID=31234 RepID=A0A6A5GI47_CAERE|nr:hypothetical protein GCK72_021433 [Caenorhabditis remanei]KAF1754868.1 hypothetical protein GCK72_021433 [Caenorhabditis remanei]